MDKKIFVQNKEISLLQVGKEMYVSLTDILKGEEGTDHIKNWMRNRNTVEYLGLWEVINNPNFKGVEFDTFRKEAGLNSFTLTPKKWIEATNAIGIVSKPGNSGGTYAHRDLALEFCTWLSPLFKLLVLKEFQRLKEEEAKNSNLQWDFRRYVSKVNYKIQTDTIKAVLVPIKNVSKAQERFIYAEEADLIYLAMFDITSKQWREKFPQHDANGLNIRDVANSHQLIVLANLESANSLLINAGYLDAKERLIVLRKQSIMELKSLQTSNQLEHELVISPNSLLHPNNQKKLDINGKKPSDFNQKLNQALKFNPKDKLKEDENKEIQDDTDDEKKKDDK